VTVVERAAPTFPDLFDVIAGNISRAVQGKPESIELALTGLLAEGHLLIEDVPGVGKTSLAKAIAASIDCTWRRVQCTPDLLPSDVTGVTVWHRGRDSFEFQPGPVFCNILLADEINRASPRTQSALLEAMAERQVTAEGVRRVLPDPFFVVATQNPVESAGTYPLPEAQLDRFALRFGLGYVKPEQEVEMLAAQKGAHPLQALAPVASLAEVVAMCHAVTEVRISDDVRRYIVAIVGATRGRGAIRLGASPRASLALQRLSQALALIDGEDFVTPDHVREIAVPALAHRVTLDSHARFSGASSEQIVAETMRAVALPA